MLSFRHDFITIMVTLLLISGLHNKGSVLICHFNRRKVANKPRISKPIKKHKAHTPLGAAKICFASYSCDTVIISSLLQCETMCAQRSDYMINSDALLLTTHVALSSQHHSPSARRTKRVSMMPLLKDNVTRAALEVFVSVAPTSMHARASHIEGQYL